MALEQTKRYKKSSAEKYANAIERLQNTDLPTAKVAAEFGLNPETFRMYLREHHPELVTARGMIRTSDGKVVSNRSAEKYAEALRIYATTSESLKSIAKRLGLTYNSVGGFIRRNYPEAIEKHNSLLVSLSLIHISITHKLPVIGRRNVSVQQVKRSEVCVTGIGLSVSQTVKLLKNMRRL